MYSKFWDVLGKVAIGFGLVFIVFMVATVSYASHIQHLQSLAG